MPKLLFLGCNYNQLPYVKAVKSLGFTVVGTDLNPEAPGALLVDSFHVVGYNDQERLATLVQDEGFGSDDRIFTASAHFAWEGAAAVAARLGIKYLSPETVDICIDKSKLYPLMDRLGVPVPSTVLLGVEDDPVTDPDNVYYLKSDYGKSPRYCYRITNGVHVQRPVAFDRYYRSCFLLQQEVLGLQYRVNLYGDQAAVFLKFTDHCAVPLSVLGPGHAAVIAGLRGIVTELGLQGVMTKFDLIVNESGWFVIDLGLDPPMRMLLLCQYKGIDFPSAYVRGHILGDWSGMPSWNDLVAPPVAIHATDEEGIRYTPLGERQ